MYTLLIMAGLGLWLAAGMRPLASEPKTYNIRLRTHWDCDLPEWVESIDVDVGGSQVKCLRPQDDPEANTEWYGQLTVNEPLAEDKEIKLTGFTWKAVDPSNNNHAVFPENGKAHHQNLDNGGLWEDESAPTLKDIKQGNLAHFKLPGENFMGLCKRHEAMSVQVTTGQYYVTLTAPSCDLSKWVEWINVKVGDSSVLCTRPSDDTGGNGRWDGQLEVFEPLAESTKIELEYYTWVDKDASNPTIFPMNGKANEVYLKDGGLMYEGWTLPTLGEAQKGAVRFKLPEVMEKCTDATQAMVVYTQYQDYTTG